MTDTRNASPAANRAWLVKAQRLWSNLVAIVLLCWQQMNRDNATQMAAALTYRTIFSLVPMFVLALIVFRAFVGFEDIGQGTRQRIYSFVGFTALSQGVAGGASAPIDTAPESAQPVAPATSPTQPATDTQPAQSDEQVRKEAQTLVQHRVDQILNDLTNKVSTISFRSIGAIGFLLLIWAALALAIDVETFFNRIYNSPSGRPWHMRIVIYWAMITLGPVLIGVSLWLTGQVRGQIEGYFNVLETYNQHLGILGDIVRWLSQFAALLAGWLLLFLLYVLMPTTKVKLKPALIGSLVGAILWEAGKQGFQYYVKHSVSYSMLYGSLGLIPLFLLWIYITWLIVLFGLEVTYLLQTTRRGQYHKAADAEEPLMDPQWAIPILAQLARALDQGQSLDPGQIAAALRLPVRAVERLCARLEEMHLIHRVESGVKETVCYSLSKSPDKVSVQEILEAAQGLTLGDRSQSDPQSWSFVRKLAAAQTQAAAGATLASIAKG